MFHSSFVLYTERVKAAVIFEVPFFPLPSYLEHFEKHRVHMYLLKRNICTFLFMFRVTENKWRKKNSYFNESLKLNYLAKMILFIATFPSKFIYFLHIQNKNVPQRQGFIAPVPRIMRIYLHKNTCKWIFHTLDKFSFTILIVFYTDLYANTTRRRYFIGQNRINCNICRTAARANCVIYLRKCTS